MGSRGRAVNWQDLEKEISQWRGAGRAPDLWWRDDDAGGPSPALDQLLALARRSGVPLALAVIPAQADSRVLSKLDAGITVLQHGTDHVNRAGTGEKKTEFPVAGSDALFRLIASRKSLEEMTGERFCAVLAPPWNRLADALLPQLATSGYIGVSRYGARRAAEPAPGLRQVNTHVDIIDWQGSRGFVGEQRALGALVRHLAERRDGTVDIGEATGLLTHHACHDEAAWRFLERLFATTREAGASWRSASALFQ